ncbi:MAG: hypothetical protein U0271_21755 [Polyangiaceae bacterium]
MNRGSFGVLLLVAASNLTGCMAGDVDSIEDAEELADEDVQVASDELSVLQWGADQSISNESTADAPVIANYRGAIHLVHTGSSSNKLYHQIFNGSSWSPSIEIPEQRSRYQPALAALGGKGDSLLHMVHMGDTSDDLWWSYYDGVSWSKNIHLPFTSMMPPVMANYGGKLHLFGNYMTIQGDALVPTLWEAEFDGVNWGIWHGIETFVDGAGVAAHNGKLVLVTRNGTYLYMSTSTGGAWTIPVQLLGKRSKSAPALASFGGVLHMTHLGETSNRIWWSTWDGAAWTQDEAIANQASRFVPSLASFGTKLMQAHIGDTSDKIWWSVFQ